MLKRLVTIGALALGACTQQPAQLTEAQLVERGAYLVMNSGCNDCHTQMTPQGPDMTRALQGAPLFFRPAEGVEIPGWVSVAPQIAGLPEGWSDAQMITFLQNNVRPDGTRPSPPMPPFQWTEEDARAITAYIKTLPKSEQ